MIDRIALFKLAPADATPERRDAIAAAVARLARERGFEVRVGTPADAPSAKSWDLSVVVRGPDVATVDGVDVEALVVLAGATVEFRKGWSFAIV